MLIILLVLEQILLSEAKTVHLYFKFSELIYYLLTNFVRLTS